jgi:hypothetical protein
MKSLHGYFGLNRSLKRSSQLTIGIFMTLLQILFSVSIHMERESEKAGNTGVTLLGIVHSVNGFITALGYKVRRIR